MDTIQIIVLQLRKLRMVHKYIGVFLALFIFISASTGILLGWKKNSGTLQPPTIEGTSADLRQWKTFHEISRLAIRAMDSVNQSGNSIDRFDVRPAKGIVKVLFTKGYWEVQIDGSSGSVLSVAQRHSDWIEHLHDGSIIGEAFKLTFTNILGMGLIILSLTGVYMWYAPKIVRRSKQR